MVTGNWMRHPAMLLVTALIIALYLYGYGDKISRNDAAETGFEMRTAASQMPLPTR